PFFPSPRACGEKVASAEGASRMRGGPSPTLRFAQGTLSPQERGEGKDQFVKYSDTDFQRPSWIWHSIARSVPRCLVGEKVFSSAPNISAGNLVDSIALLSVSGVRSLPAALAAAPNRLMISQP